MSLPGWATQLASMLGCLLLGIIVGMKIGAYRQTGTADQGRAPPLQSQADGRAPPLQDEAEGRNHDDGLPTPPVAIRDRRADGATSLPVELYRSSHGAPGGNLHMHRDCFHIRDCSFTAHTPLLFHMFCKRFVMEMGV